MINPKLTKQLRKTRNLFGSTALICAAANGYISTMEELLLDDRVDLEVSTRLGQTALFKAVTWLGPARSCPRVPFVKMRYDEIWNMRWDDVYFSMYHCGIIFDLMTSPLSGESTDMATPNSTSGAVRPHEHHGTVASSRSASQGDQQDGRLRQKNDYVGSKAKGGNWQVGPHSGRTLLEWRRISNVELYNRIFWRW